MLHFGTSKAVVAIVEGLLYLIYLISTGCSYQGSSSITGSWLGHFPRLAICEKKNIWTATGVQNHAITPFL
jgi:hypothetical protein